MTVLTADAFDRTNANPIGAPWTTITNNSAMQIVSNQATPSTLAADCASWISGTYPNDQYAQARFFVNATSSAGGTGSCLFARCATGANTNYRLSANHGGTTNLQLGKFVANAFTSLWIRLQAWTDGDLFRLECRGTTIRVFINGVQVGADAVDASVTAGQPGMGYSSVASTSAAVDNFQAGDFGSSLVVEQSAIYRASNW